jgi:hypothetical protein
MDWIGQEIKMQCLEEFRKLSSGYFVIVFVEKYESILYTEMETLR